MPEFITNVTHTPEDDDCAYNVVQSYQLALGARAGATIALGDNTWGPMPSTSVPIFNHVMRSICAETKTPTTANAAMITTAAEHRKRQDLSTTTTIVSTTYTGVHCANSALLHCPVSSQITWVTVETRTITAALPSGSEFETPVTVMSSVPSPIAFKSGSESIPAISGSPVSYIPPPPKKTSKVDGIIDGAIADAKDTYKDNKPLIIGLASGLGGAALIAIIAALM